LKEAWDSPQGVSVEADFIAAVLGEGTVSLAVPRFLDGVKLLDFAGAWRASSDTGAWVNVPAR
jgi:hypothetical protein